MPQATVNQPPPQSTRSRVGYRITALLALLPAVWAWSLPAPAQTRYACDFETAQVGRLPDDFLSLNGAFAVRSLGSNHVLELPGAPLDGYVVQFGPATTGDVAVRARIFGTARGRRSPAFGIGLAGAGGWRLQVSPGRKALELFRGETLCASAAYDWSPGTWTRLRLQLRQLGEAKWRVEGRAWPDGHPEPEGWPVAIEESQQPPRGRASVTGCPFSGTPIWYDDLHVEQLAPVLRSAAQGGSTGPAEAGPGRQTSNQP